MSKKRNKNQRKKQTRGRSARHPDSEQPAVHGRAPETPDPAEEEDLPNPETQVPVTSGGGLGPMRSFMTRAEEGPDAGLLRKRRSCGELLIWLGAAGGIVYYVFHKLG